MFPSFPLRNAGDSANDWQSDRIDLIGQLFRSDLPGILTDRTFCKDLRSRLVTYSALERSMARTPRLWTVASPAARN